MAFDPQGDTMRPHALVTVCFCVLINLATAADDARPNLLLIVADDLCYRDLGFNGNSDVKTPNLDRLASEGVQLTGVFNPATTCSPTRHALYTGLYPIRSGAFPNHTRVYDGTRSMFHHLRDAGYRVALQGKEHVGPKSSFPYEHFAGVDSGNLSETRKFVTRDTKQPWLLVYASHDPHSPWDRGPRHLHDPQSLKLPSYLHDNQPTRSALAAYYREVNKFDSQVGALLDLLEETSADKNTLVVFVSEQGNSLPYGGKWSLYDNGIHAAAVARWPGHIKAGSNNAALVSYVDIAPTFLVAAGVDPTTIDTGCPDATGDAHFDGKNALDVLTGKTDKFRDHVFSQHTTVGIIGYEQPYPMRAVRDTRYKYIRNLAPDNQYSISGIHKYKLLDTWRADAASDPKLAARIEWLGRRPAEELYDTQADPDETNNLADDPQLAAVKARLSGELDKWMQQQGDQGLETEMLAPTRQKPEREAAAQKKAKGKARRAARAA